MTDPGSLSDPDGPSLINALIDDRRCNAFVCVIVINNEDHLADQDVRL